MKLVIHGAPRTKKNHQRILRGRGGRPFVAQSKQHNEWAESAVLQLMAGRGKIARRTGATMAFPLMEAVNLRALVYREKRTGDLGNYLAAVCDVLERAGVVLNDRLIEGFDGSRLLVDRHIPRVEIELTPMAPT